MEKDIKPQIINRIALGDYIAEKRRKAGFKNREELARAIKEETSLVVSAETIKRIERGEGLPSLEVFLAIATTLKNTVGLNDDWWEFVTDSLTSCMDGHLGLLQIKYAVSDLMQGLQIDMNMYGNAHDGWFAERYSPEDYMKSSALQDRNWVIKSIEQDLTHVSAYTPEDEELKTQIARDFKATKQAIAEHELWVKSEIRAKPAQ